MKQPVMAIALIALCACAAQDAPQKVTGEDVQNQAIMDFVNVREIAEVDKIRSRERDGWDELTMTYIIYKARRDRYLVEFARPCYELRDNTEITPDYRSDSNAIRARFDTLRGCRIARIFALNQDEADELKNIGEAPGKRN